MGMPALTPPPLPPDIARMLEEWRRNQPPKIALSWRLEYFIQDVFYAYLDFVDGFTRLMLKNEEEFV